MKKKTKSVGVRLEPVDLRRLTNLKKKLRFSKTRLVKEALEHLSRKEGLEL